MWSYIKNFFELLFTFYFCAAVSLIAPFLGYAVFELIEFIIPSFDNVYYYLGADFEDIGLYLGGIIGFFFAGYLTFDSHGNENRQVFHLNLLFIFIFSLPAFALVYVYGAHESFPGFILLMTFFWLVAPLAGSIFWRIKKLRSLSSS